MRNKRNITANEEKDSLNFLVYWEQLQRLEAKKGDCLKTKSVQVKHSVNITVIHTVFDSRIKSFPLRYSSKEEILVLPNSNFSRRVGVSDGDIGLLKDPKAHQGERRLC